MGSLSWLVSDAKKEYCDLGRTFFTDMFVLRLARCAPDKCEKEIQDYLTRDPDSVNHETPDPEAAEAAARAVEWMRSHPDWRYLNEYDEGFDDVYLAEDEEDAAEYREELGDEANPIYRKTGNIWPSTTDDGDGPDPDDVPLYMRRI